MGTKKNVNTTFQRLRYISLNNIFQANLKPSTFLELEIEYTFDERLILTLVSQNDKNARFKLEIASENTEITEVPITPRTSNITRTNSIDPKTLIPNIPRIRQGKEIEPKIKVNFKDWENVAFQLQKNWSNARLHQRRRDLEKQTAIAANRSSIIDDLVRWLEIDNFWGGANHSTKTLIAVLSLGEILASINPQESINIKNSEMKFEQWVHSKINQNLSGVDNQLYDAIGNLPGKLLWDGFDLKLIEAFKCFQREARALVFINSLGKCGQCNSNNLNFLKNVLKNSRHLGQKEKAAWALARLISPGQPEDYRINFQQVESIASFALEQLYRVIKEPQIALTMLGCLSQCLAWHALDYELSTLISQQIEKLPKIDLPVYHNLSGFPPIESIFDTRLQLLPKMLNISNISEEDSSQFKIGFLELI
jgi:hypothetical protein